MITNHLFVSFSAVQIYDVSNNYLLLDLSEILLIRLFFLVLLRTEKTEKYRKDTQGIYLLFRGNMKDFSEIGYILTIGTNAKLLNL